MSLRGAALDFIASGLPPREEQAAATELLALRLATTSGAAPVELPPVESLDLVAARLARALAAGERPGRRDLRLAPWCLWSTATPLAGVPGGVEGLIAAIRAAGRPRLIAALASAYAEGFAPGRAGLAAIAGFLTEQADGLGDPWAAAERDFSIFSPDAAAERIAGAALAKGETPGEVLEAAGLGQPLGLTLAAFRAGFARLAEGGNGDPQGRMEQVAHWAFAGDVVRFEVLRAVAVEAVVVPFGRVPPEGALREAALGLVMRLLGDPRADSGRWTGASRAEPIVRRWLDGAALVRFLDTVGDGGDEDPWAHRRAFWSALYERGHVDATRIVFAGAETGVGAVAARGLFGAGAALARFTGDTVPAGHSVLLMRVGTLVIADWSHGAPCFIWDEERGETAPDLARDAFDPDELRKAISGDNSEANTAKQGKFLHRGSNFYKWQGAVADFLRGRRGIVLTRADYELRP